MNTSGYYDLRKLCFWLVLFAVPCFAFAQSPLYKLRFVQKPSPEMLVSNEVQKVYQDRSGFIWLATRNGLCQYDGYKVNTYKSNMYMPDILTNNNILCIQEDASHNLWMGTQDGLNVMDLKTGNIRKYVYPAIPNNLVSCILVTSDNQVWIGTDKGLCRYIAARDSFVVYGKEQTEGILKAGSVKSLHEDADGDIWMGLWGDGLYRYCVSEDKFYAYPTIGKRNSPHVIFEDSGRNIWVGTWGDGLYRLEHPKDFSRLAYVPYRHHPDDDRSLVDDIVYAIEEDPHTRSLWVGTRMGLSILPSVRSTQFINYMPRRSPYYIPSDEVNSIISDAAGNIWIGTIGGGVWMTDTKGNSFHSNTLDYLVSGALAVSVRSLFADRDGNLWAGIGTVGLACKKEGSDKFVPSSRLPEFSSLSLGNTVTSIMQRKQDKSIWFGCSGGIVALPYQGKAYWLEFQRGSMIEALYEDSKGNCWIGTRTSLNVQRADGKLLHWSSIDFEDGISARDLNVKDIIEDTDGSRWVATSNYGLIHVNGNLEDAASLRFCNYSVSNGRLMTNTVLCLYMDSRQRLWVGTEGGGLYLYDRAGKRFVPKSREYAIPGDMVASIEEDGKGNLWLGTNEGLIKLSGADKNPVVRIYAVNDGLLDKFFIAKSSCKYNGELLFGNYKGYNSFVPDEIEETHKEAPLAVTDIRIHNRSLSAYPQEVRNRLSAASPAFTEELVIPYKYNNFSIEFAALTYLNPNSNKYAFQLQGFDNGWQYVDAAHRVAYYNNLGSGKYTFLLKATDENGVWGNNVRELAITVLPPFWKTWWAYLVYVLLAVGIVYWVFRTMRKRMLLRNELHLREVEKAEIEKLNHAKLQFFTNITHELLTPLTVLTASVEDLKQEAPAYEPKYKLMMTNINRLIRLLQQILEFRKAETGNLKLKVSRGDLALFIRHSVDAFVPLLKKKGMKVTLSCRPAPFIVYFDPDKFDKILYNLLSNAAKYNLPDETVSIELVRLSEEEAQLTVKDNGPGISKEAQKDLFKRFYEGSYRKYNTIGTGIGLSLVHDLVTLHHGSIRVESEEGKGAAFIVSFPTGKSNYAPEELDQELLLSDESVPHEISGVEDMDVVIESSGEEEPAKVADKEKKCSLLLVEDNGELLGLMARILSKDYTVYTAKNGEEGLGCTRKHDIDLIVSDVMMPVMDGITFCRKIKGDFDTSHIPFLLLTAKNQEEDRVEAYESGADAFITKPFSLTLLQARIANLLAARERKTKTFKKQLVFEVKELDFTSMDEDFLQKAVDTIHRHLGDSAFGQAQFVEEMHTTRSTAFRKLKSLTGLTFPAFLRNIRMKAACRIMEEKKGIKIAELAYGVGYSDPAYFSVCFKKEIGVSPAEYMEQLRHA